MRGKTICRAWLLATWAALVPGVASAQFSTGYAPPDSAWTPTTAPNVPLPLYSTHPEEGGLFLAGKYVMYRQTNPLENQAVAYRGFRAVDDSVLGPGTAGTFIGSQDVALDIDQVTGPNKYVPGFTVEGGWKFLDGSALTLSYMRLFSHRTQAVATLAPRDLLVRSDFADSFLTSPVFNFPAEYGGPVTSDHPDLPPPANPAAAFGLWNGAEEMSLDFEQRFNQWEATYRVPVYDTECYRLSGLVGPRVVWIWERLKWRTVDTDVNGQAGPQDVGLYTNIVSNRMYGVFAGCRQEWYIGHGFACQLDLNGAIFYDSVLERAKYELDIKNSQPAHKRAQRDVQFVPELQGTFSIAWFPIEGVQIQLGYDVMSFFNTISSPQPIDFNYGSVNPPWRSTFRVFDGFQAGVAIIF